MLKKIDVLQSRKGNDEGSYIPDNLSGTCCLHHSLAILPNINFFFEVLKSEMTFM
jgi:hypothetical protein